MERILKINDLNVFYGRIHAVNDISLSVKKGEIISLIGANGAGKTSTLQAISGIVPKSGEISFEGQNISKMEADKIVKLGISHVPEGRRVFKELTVDENLEMGGVTRTNSENKEMKEHVYTLFPRLRERKKQYAGTMSGGEQQMLAIGRALMNRPKLLILDEPSMGLAPMLVKEIFEIIQRINKEDEVTILLVEQNANMALSISDRAYVLETGKIVLKGNASELQNNEEIKVAYLG